MQVSKTNFLKSIALWLFNPRCKYNNFFAAKLLPLTYFVSNFSSYCFHVHNNLVLMCNHRIIHMITLHLFFIQWLLFLIFMKFDFSRIQRLIKILVVACYVLWPLLDRIETYMKSLESVIIYIRKSYFCI